MKKFLSLIFVGIGLLTNAQSGIFSKSFTHIIKSPGYAFCNVIKEDQNEDLDQEGTNINFSLGFNFGIYFKTQNILYALKYAEQNNLLSYKNLNLFPVRIDDNSVTIVTVIWENNRWQYFAYIPKEIPAGTKIFQSIKPL